MYISNVNSASVKLTSITTQQLPANEHHKIASEDLLIFYVNKGAGICHSEYEQHEIKKRDVIILNPGTTITLDPIRKIDWICIAHRKPTLAHNYLWHPILTQLSSTTWTWL